jgi:hypothetical protein
MDKDKKINIVELKKTFRIKDGNIERLDHRFKNIKWSSVKNISNGNNGYCHISFCNGGIYYHVIVWILSTGKGIPRGYEIDHINGNKIDNRIENLRLVSRRENQQNQKRHREGKLFGCSLHKPSNKYLAKIRIGGKRIHIGRYKTEEEAHIAYKIACKHISNYIDSASFRKLIKKEISTLSQK